MIRLKQFYEAFFNIRHSNLKLIDAWLCDLPSFSPWSIEPLERDAENIVLTITHFTDPNSWKI